MTKLYGAIGLMSGTSMDGIDAAFIRTDGQLIDNQNQHYYLPFPESFRKKLLAASIAKHADPDLIRDISEYHVEATKTLIKNHNLAKNDIDVVGFHGQTIHHDPKKHISLQVGDATYLAGKLQLDIVHNFRKNDLLHGGQGAPLIPIYHQAIAQNLLKPIIFVNIGGIANISYVSDSELIAFDTGPGNILIDLLAKQQNHEFDKGGQIAATGNIDYRVLDKLFQDPFFFESYPKSLDKHHFSEKLQLFSKLDFADKIATATKFTSLSIARSIMKMPEAPHAIYVQGGGRKNITIMQQMVHELGNVQPIEAIGLDGDFTEAEAFAFLAIRSKLKLPLTLPTTTGTKEAVTGGTLVKAI